MTIIKTEGLIIRVMDYLESSKIITCFTPDQGKVSLLAKGARRPKSRLGGALDLMQHVGLVYYSKDTRELQTLSQVEIISSFQSFQSDLRILSYGLAVLELIDKLEHRTAPNPILFNQSIKTLHGLEKTRNPELVFYQFVWRWLENEGYHPKLRRCLSCLKPPSAGRVKFSIQDGGYFCQNCDSSTENCVDISQKCLKLLLLLRESSEDRVAKLSVPREIISELANISLIFLRFHAGEFRKLKSLDFLNKI